MIERFREEAPRSLLDPLMEQIRPIFLSWYDRGGSLAEVERQVESKCRSFQPRLESLVEERTRRLTQDVLKMIRTYVQDWLDRHGVQRNVDEFIPPDVSGCRQVGMGKGLAGELANPIAQRLTAALMAITFTVAVAVKVTVVSAVLPFFLTPVGAVVVAVGAILGAGVTRNLVREHNRGNWPVQTDRWMMQRLLARRALLQKLDASLDQGCEQLRQELTKPLVQIQKQATDSFDEVIEQLIEDLGLLETIRRGS